MKIIKIKWNNHPILGNLELDLNNSTTGLPYETVILAGENGTGKSTILESVSNFLNLGSFEFFDYIEYVINGNFIKAIAKSNDSFGIHDGSGNINYVYWKKPISPIPNKDLRYYGCVFSKARSDYKTNKITGTGTSRLDENRYDTDSNDDYTSLKQLIVDLQNQDYSEYSEENRNLGTKCKSWQEFYPNSKISRFKDSFDNFFEQIKFDNVVDNLDEKSILFAKNGKLISIDHLSTGEKQIVFRGIYLLKNHKVLDGSIVMIDEPEISMHPKWQQRILKYYKDLFYNDGHQIAQLFFATHSDHVVKDALLDNSTTIVLTLEQNGTNIGCRKNDMPSVLPSITSAETNFLAFDIVTIDYHIQLYGWLQEKKSRNTVKSCDAYIIAQSNYNSRIHRKPSSFGKTNYESLCTYIRNVIHHPESGGNTFSEQELRISIELLIELCK